MTGIQPPVPPRAPAAPRAPQSGVRRWPVVPKPRWQYPDLTGFYESPHQPGGPYSGLLVQINQAGRMLAGWAAPPPNRVPAAPLTCFASDALGPQWLDRKLALVFVVDLDARREKNDAWPMYSALVRLGGTGPGSGSGSGDAWYPARDPSEVLNELAGGTNAVKGLFRLTSPADRTPVVEVQFEVGAPGFAKLTQVSAVPRVSASDGAWTAGKARPDNEPFLMWVASHARPIPSGYLEDAAGALAADWSVRKSPKPPPNSLAELAYTWWQARGGARQAARENLLNRVRNWLTSTVPTPDEVYRGQTRSALIAALASGRIEILNSNGALTGHTYLKLIDQACTEEHQHWIDHKSKGVDLSGDLKFLRTRDGTFLYTFTFNTGGALPLPPVLTSNSNVPEPGKYLRIPPNSPVTLGFNPFYMQVKKEIVTVKTDSSGQPVIGKDGKIECTSRSTVFDTTGSWGTGLVGVYFDIGLGFPKPGMDIKSTELLTPYDLTKDSFDGASFELGEIRLGTTSLVATSGQAGRSVMFHVWKDDPDRPFDITTIVVFPPGFKPITLQTKGDFLEPMPTTWKDLFTVFSFGAGRGWLVSGARSPTYTAAPQPPRPVPTANLSVAHRVDNFFTVNSHVISDSAQPVPPFSARAVLEITLAENRAALINPAVLRETLGWASPEGRTEDNQNLSEARAQALAQAYLDAFPQGTVPPIAPDRVVGLGETPALSAASLNDPETDLGMDYTNPAFRTAYETWRSRHADQAAQWPDWRRAELRVSGQTTLSASGPQTPYR